MGWHCFVGRWHSHIGQCCHCWLRLNKLGIMGDSFLWGGYVLGVIGSSGEGRIGRYLVDVFLPLAIEVFGCLHQHADTFFYWCANMMWTTKGTKGLPLLVLCSFYKHRMINMLTLFFIDVLTWCGQQRAPKAFLYWCNVPFINIECWWHYRECKLPLSWDGLLLQKRVHLDLEFYQVYLPSL